MVYDRRRKRDTGNEGKKSNINTEIKSWKRLFFVYFANLLVNILQSAADTFDFQVKGLS